MAEHPTALCFRCSNAVQDGDRAVIVSVTRGRFNATDGTVDYAPSPEPFPGDDVESIFHEQCYLRLMKTERG